MNKKIEVATVKKIRSAIEKYDYWRFGLRITHELPEDGSILDPSRRWIDGDPTDELLDGTSALEITSTTVERVFRLTYVYEGQWISLVGAESIGDSPPEDEGEIVLIDPIVLERWKKPVRRIPV